MHSQAKPPGQQCTVLAEGPREWHRQVRSRVLLAIDYSIQTLCPSVIFWPFFWKWPLVRLSAGWSCYTVEQTNIWPSSHGGSVLWWDRLSPEVLSRVSTSGAFETEPSEEAPSGRSHQKSPCLLSSLFPNGCPNSKAILMLLWKPRQEGRKLSISLLGKIEQFVLHTVCVSLLIIPDLCHSTPNPWWPKD